MERPPFAPNAIYQIMNECWQLEQDDRPSFSKLTENLYAMLEENTQSQYVRVTGEITKEPKSDKI